MSKGHYPQSEPPKLEPGEMALQIKQNMELRNLPPIDITNPEQVRQRTEDYFNFCIANDSRPHVEGLALAIGVSRQTLWNWRQAGRERGAVIDQAVQLIASLTESWGITGKLNPACFCFVMKNNFGWKDTYDHTIEAVSRPYEAYRSPEEIARMIESDIPMDEDVPVLTDSLTD